MVNAHLATKKLRADEEVRTLTSIWIFRTAGSVAHGTALTARSLSGTGWLGRAHAHAPASSRAARRVYIPSAESGAALIWEWLALTRRCLVVLAAGEAG
jgi:hypothetical protein